jgi:hypothetical protein
MNEFLSQRGAGLDWRIYSYNGRNTVRIKLRQKIF